MISQGARIIVAQTNGFMLRVLSLMRDYENSNEVFFTTDPGRVLDEVRRSSWDVVILGAMYYRTDVRKSEQCRELLKRAQRDGSHVLEGHFLPPKSGPRRGTQLASQIRRVAPRTLCLRMTLMPELYLGEFVGDIPKEDPRVVIDFIDAPELAAILAKQDWIWLRRRFPKINFFQRLDEFHPGLLTRN